MVSASEHIHANSSTFDLDAGHLALDFVNTLDNRYSAETQESLHTYRDLLAFSAQTESLSQDDIVRLAAAAEAMPEPAERQVRQAQKLREAMFSIFSRVAAGAEPKPDDLDVLNAFHQRAMSRGRLTPADDGCEWDWEDDDAFDRPLWPIVREAVALLLTGDAERLRECAADDCGWLFYDTSRNQSRRWCSMKTCGNRAKVQQFRQRRRD